MRITAVLFDLDGTIADTSLDISANVNRALQDRSFRHLSHQTIMGHVGFGAETLIRRCLMELMDPDTVTESLVQDVLEGFRQHYLQNLTTNTQLYPHVIEFLDLVDVPMAVISNKPERFVQGVLEELGLLKRFEFAWGKDSSMNPKPDPGVILEALERLDLEPGPLVWFIGDNPVDVRAAKGAGVTSVAISHGYSERQALENAGPEILVEGFADLISRYRLQIAD